MPATDSEIPLAGQPQPAGPPACAKARVSPSAIHSDSIKPLSVLHSGLECERQPILIHPDFFYIKVSFL